MIGIPDDATNGGRALLLLQAEIGALCFGLSAILRRGGLGLAMGLAALLYFAGLLINLDQGLDWLRFVTPYFYADAARIFAGETPAGPMLAGCVLGALGMDRTTRPRAAGRS